MNVYVASSFANKPAVREAIAALRAAGHAITYDWTEDTAAGLKGEALDIHLERAAMRDIRGISNADAMIVLHDERGRGMLVEFGFAVAACLDVIVVGAQRKPDGEHACVFYHLPQVTHVESLDAALSVLQDRVRFTLSA